MRHAGSQVTVLGGSGFTGSRVCKALVDGGAEVVSVSKGGKAPAWAAGEAWASSVDWRSNDLCRGSREALREVSDGRMLLSMWLTSSGPPRLPATASAHGVASRWLPGGGLARCGGLVRRRHRLRHAGVPTAARLELTHRLKLDL